MFFPRRAHYFSYQLNREVKELYWNAAIANLAVTSTYIFEPLFLYGLNYSLIDILKFYVIVYFCYSLLVFPAAYITSLIGYKHSILVSCIFYIFYWFCLYQIKFAPGFFFVAPFFFALEKSFFWPSYNSDLALNSVNAQRGREVGVLFSLIEVVSILGPLIGGVISAFFGFKTLFIYASILILASAYPLFLSDEIFTKHRFRFSNFWQIVRQRGQNFFGYWGYAEDLMLMSLWPIFIFIRVPNLLNVGFITMVASFIAVMVMLYIGKISDQIKRRLLVQIGAVFYGLTWFLRTFAVNFFSVFVFDAITRVGKGVVTVPMLALTYEIAGSKGPDHAIAYSVFYEFSLAIGKIFTALMGIWLLSLTGDVFYVFILAGILTMFYGFLKNGRK